MTRLMSIVNTSPDSFSNDGKEAVDSAITHAFDQIDAGADLLDIGGVSTKPGSATIPQTIELARTIPVIEAIRDKSNIDISIDTSNAGVAKAAIDAGVNIINDVTAGGDPDMLPLAASHRLPIILMHNKADKTKDTAVGKVYDAADHENFWPQFMDEIALIKQRALDAGIAQDNIILDPGLGFGKTVMQNLLIMKNIDQLKNLGCAVLIGASNKSFIGLTLNRKVNQRKAGTAATTALATARGADYIRVHDTKFMRDVIDMTAALC